MYRPIRSTVARSRGYFFAQRSGVKMSRDLINLMAVLELVFCEWQMQCRVGARRLAAQRVLGRASLGEGGAGLDLGLGRGGTAFRRGGGVGTSLPGVRLGLPALGSS